MSENEPVIYTTSKGFKIGMSILCIPLIILFLIGSLSPLFSTNADNSSFTITNAVFALFGLVGLLGLIAIFKSKIEVHHNMIRDIGIFSERQLGTESIIGYKIVQLRSSKSIVFIPEDPGLKKLSISLVLNDNEGFLKWAADNFKDISGE